MILARASGAPVLSLDLWMVGESACRNLLAHAAAEADLILIEGVMGLFDGTPSSADLATTFGVPVLAVISAKAMAQTFGAVAFGLAQFRPQLPFYGVLANRVGSPRHAQMLEEAYRRPALVGPTTAQNRTAIITRPAPRRRNQRSGRAWIVPPTRSRKPPGELPPPVEFGAMKKRRRVFKASASPLRAMPRSRYLSGQRHAAGTLGAHHSSHSPTKRSRRRALAPAAI